MADLFANARRPAERPQIVAEYDFIDLAGVLVAQKVRFSNKTFRWRAPDEAGSLQWRLGGAQPGLYRLPELIEVPQVFVTEGEKAVDLLWSLDLPATCPPAGASTWNPEWSQDLLTVGCREAVILADNDRAGQLHAERVAGSIHDCRRGELTAIRVVALPGLQKGADVFDWLQGGHTAADLLNVVSGAPYWAPGAQEREKVQRRRAQTRERVRRHRAARKLQLVRLAS